MQIALKDFLLKSEMTTLILIRHGETKDNAVGRYIGHTDPDLNPEGLRQAKALYARLSAMPVDHIYTSDLKRAVQTARGAFPHAPILEEPAFREMHFGVFEGLLYDELQERFSQEYQAWLTDPVIHYPPEGESLQGMKKRVLCKMAAILNEHAGASVAIVSHAGPIKIILLNALDYDLSKFWDVDQAHGTISIIKYDEKGRAHVAVRNDKTHLVKPGAMME